MTLPSLASAEDLGSWLGESIAADDARATVILSGASTLVRSYSGQTWVEDEELTDVPDDAWIVTIQVAARAWENPTGATQESQTLGTFAEAASYSSKGSGLWLSASEKLMLDAFRPTSGLWAQPITRNNAEIATVYAGVGGTTEKIPWISETPY